MWAEGLPFLQESWAISPILLPRPQWHPKTPGCWGCFAASESPGPTPCMHSTEVNSASFHTSQTQQNQDKVILSSLGTGEHKCDRRGFHSQTVMNYSNTVDITCQYWCVLVTPSPTSLAGTSTSLPLPPSQTPLIHSPFPCHPHSPLSLGKRWQSSIEWWGSFVLLWGPCTRVTQDSSGPFLGHSVKRIFQIMLLAHLSEILEPAAEITQNHPCRCWIDGM